MAVRNRTVWHLQFTQRAHVPPAYPPWRWRRRRGARLRDHAPRDRRSLTPLSARAVTGGYAGRDEQVSRSIREIIDEVKAERFNERLCWWPRRPRDDVADLGRSTERLACRPAFVGRR